MKKAEEMILEGANRFLPHLSADIVILGYREGTIQCLLLRIGPKWVLPGGYIGKEESVEAAVRRTLKERTGLEQAHLKFLSVFGASNRNFSKEFQQFFKQKNLPWDPNYWINGRFVTLAYYALVDMDRVSPSRGTFDEEIAWFDLQQLPSFWMDHARIVQTAQEQLQQDVRLTTISYNLLPESFTMPQLHQLHQTILQETLDRSRFQKKMLATGLFERLPQLKQESPGRNPYQYRIKTP